MNDHKTESKSSEARHPLSLTRMIMEVPGVNNDLFMGSMYQRVRNRTPETLLRADFDVDDSQVTAQTHIKHRFYLNLRTYMVHLRKLEAIRIFLAPILDCAPDQTLAIHQKLADRLSREPKFYEDCHEIFLPQLNQIPQSTFTDDELAHIYTVFKEAIIKALKSQSGTQTSQINLSGFHISNLNLDIYVRLPANIQRLFFGTFNLNEHNAIRVLAQTGVENACDSFKDLLTKRDLSTLPVDHMFYPIVQINSRTAEILERIRLEGQGDLDFTNEKVYSAGWTKIFAQRLLRSLNDHQFIGYVHFEEICERLFTKLHLSAITDKKEREYLKKFLKDYIVCMTEKAAVQFINDFPVEVFKEKLFKKEESEIKLHKTVINFMKKIVLERVELDIICPPVPTKTTPLSPISSLSMPMSPREKTSESSLSPRSIPDPDAPLSLSAKAVSYSNTVLPLAEPGSLALSQSGKSKPKKETRDQIIEEGRKLREEKKKDQVPLKGPSLTAVLKTQSAPTPPTLRAYQGSPVRQPAPKLQGVRDPLDSPVTRPTEESNVADVANSPKVVTVSPDSVPSSSVSPLRSNLRGESAPTPRVHGMRPAFKKEKTVNAAFPAPAPAPKLESRLSRAHHDLMAGRPVSPALDASISSPALDLSASRRRLPPSLVLPVSPHANPTQLSPVLPPEMKLPSPVPELTQPIRPEPITKGPLAEANRFTAFPTPVVKPAPISLSSDVASVQQSAPVQLKPPAPEKDEQAQMPHYRPPSPKPGV